MIPKPGMAGSGLKAKAKATLKKAGPKVNKNPKPDKKSGAMKKAK